MKFLRKKPTKEQLQEAEEWNNWKPGSGRKGWSPFNKPIPQAQWRDSEGRPLKPDGTLDTEKFIQEMEK
jgi:hypothetical protein